LIYVIANASYSHLYWLHLNPLSAYSMIVCVCHRVSDREIARHVRAGMNFDDIQLELGVGTQCGRCEGCARDVVAQCSTTAPTAAIELTGAAGNGSAAPVRA
jgi:bacterioferritin-associated ferredoxin